MKTDIFNLINDVFSRGANIYEQDGKPRFKAPAGALTEDLYQKIKENKKDIIDIILGKKESFKLHRLSAGQQSLWFIYRLEPKNPGYNVGFALRIHSGIDVDVLKRALQLLTNRHQVLRTTFFEKDGEVFQKIHAYKKINFKKTDAFGWDEEKIRDKVQKAHYERFDLEKEAFRAELFKIAENQSVLLFSAHHIITDGWSSWLIMEEIEKIYEAELKGKPAALEPIEAAYTDYIEGENALIQSDEGEKLWAYWEKALSGHISILNLPADRARPPVPSYKGGSVYFGLNTNLTEKLKKMSKEKGATVYVILLSAFQILMHRYTGQDDIIISSPVAGRIAHEFRNTAGYFINMLPLRAVFSKDISFDNFLEQQKTVFIESFKHGQYPFSLIVKRLGINRDAASMPLSQVSFTFQKPQLEDSKELISMLTGEKKEFNWAGLKVSSFELKEQEGIWDISLQVLDNKDYFSCILKYNADLFGNERIGQIAEHFKVILEDILDNPYKKISELNLITEQEKNKILLEFNGEEADYPKDKCIHELFEEQAEKTPDCAAVVFKDKSITYRELNERANQVAHFLRSLGVGPEVIVGLNLRISIDMVVCLFGILKAGGAYLPIDNELPASRLNFLLKDSGAKVLLTEKSLLDRAACPEDIKVVCIDEKDSLISDQPYTNPANVNSIENLIYAIYTSGSTGEPKGVLIEHKSIVNYLTGLNKRHNTGSYKSYAMVSTVAADLGLTVFYSALLYGGTLHLLAKQDITDPEKFADYMQSNKIECIKIVPSHLASLKTLDGYASILPQKLLIIGGEKASFKLIENIVGKVPQIINHYGPTEATIGVLTYKVDKQSIQKGYMSVPIGRPILGAKIYILDKYLNPVPIGIDGELYISGEGLARGYINRPELNAERFIKNPFTESSYKLMYKTGDLCRWLPDGNIEYIGRIDDQIKIRGFRIEPGEIEATLSRLPYVKECSVNVYKTESGEKHLTAYIVKDKVAIKNFDEEDITASIRTEIKKSLPDYMLPAFFVFMDALPLNPNGKIDKKGLPKPQIVNKADSVMPQNETQRLISTIWQELIGIDNIGIYDNFFEVGGHSLLSIKLQSRLQKAFDRQISITDIFRYPTIDSMAHYITGHITDKARHKQTDFYKKSGDSDIQIAIIGIAVRVPGAKTQKELWQNLKDSVESVTFFSDKELTDLKVDPKIIKSKNYVKASAVIEDIDMFDANFFNFNPREAEIADPQQRIFLEAVYEALENAGCPADTDKTIGVYASSGRNTYLINNIYKNPVYADSIFSHEVRIGNSQDFLSTRVSYKLNFKGPSLNIQTACSSSLAAVHIACRDLIEKNCEMALAGGVSILIPQENAYPCDKGMIISPNGRCRAFDAKADGTVVGNGCAVVVLKRLEDAVKDRDNIIAVIKASALNNDGGVKVGYTAPSIEGQIGVISKAQAIAGVAPEDITYVETHGTGTEIGDPIEIEALTKAFNTQKRNFCAIGSIKTNMGHLDPAAGVAGLVKAAIAVKEGFIPPSLNFTAPNPKIDFKNSPFYVADKLIEWKASPRIAGVSSFGIGGTNVHAIIQQAPEIEYKVKQKDFHLIVLSAKTASALQKIALNLRLYLQEKDSADLSEIAYTLQTGRKVFDHRCFFVCEKKEQAIEKLTTGDGVYKAVFDAKNRQYDKKDEQNINFDTEKGLEKLGMLWLDSPKIDWDKFYKDQDRPIKIQLPTYPFERKSFWISPGKMPENKTDITYIPSWKMSNLSDLDIAVQKEKILWLIFADDLDIGKKIAEELAGYDHKAITVKKGLEFNKDHFKSLIKETAENLKANQFKVINIIHLWSVYKDTSLQIADRVNLYKETGLYSFLFLIQAIGEHLPDTKINIAAITNNMQKVIGGDLLFPEKALILGGVKTVQMEYPNIKCVSIDIDLNRQSGNLHELIIKEFSNGLADNTVSYRQNSRFVQTFNKIKLEYSEKIDRLKEDGVYLITGGLGGIGLELAKYIAGKVKAKIVLTSRSEFPQQDRWDSLLESKETSANTRITIKKLKEIQSLGSKIMVTSADVSDSGQMQFVIEKVQEKFGKISGVIHSAGVADGALIAQRDIDITEKILSPKVQGTLILKDLLKDYNLDFFILCSSRAAIVGIAGRFGYCGANAFLDAFANFDNDFLTTSINWITWSEAGMSVKAAKDGVYLKAEQSLLSSQGTDIFGRILNNLFSQVVLSEKPLDFIIKNYDTYKMVSDHIDIAAQKTRHPRPDLKVKYLPPKTETAKKLASIWGDILGIDKVGELDDFFELGGDSLLGIRVISRISDQINLDLPAGFILKMPILSDLAEHIDSMFKLREKKDKTDQSTKIDSNQREVIRL